MAERWDSRPASGFYEYAEEKVEKMMLLAVADTVVFDTDTHWKRFEEGAGENNDQIDLLDTGNTLNWLTYRVCSNILCPSLEPV